jgi:hypothetical protein
LIFKRVPFSLIDEAGAVDAAGVVDAAGRVDQ